MPLLKFTCSVCGARCPKEYLAEGRFKDRMAWLRRHRKRKHPTAHAKSVKKAVETKSKGGKVKKRKGKKWGKIGAPHSAKRKKHLARIRKRR